MQMSLDRSISKSNAFFNAFKLEAKNALAIKSALMGIQAGISASQKDLKGDLRAALKVKRGISDKLMQVAQA